MNACTLAFAVSSTNLVCRALNFIFLLLYCCSFGGGGGGGERVYFQGAHGRERKMRLCFKQKEVYPKSFLRSASGGGVPARRDINLTFWSAGTLRASRFILDQIVLFREPSHETYSRASSWLLHTLNSLIPTSAAVCMRVLSGVRVIFRFSLSIWTLNTFIKHINCSGQQKVLLVL